MSQHSQKLIGQRLGIYELQALLGEGGMGTVYQGFDTRLERLVAVKVMSPTLATQEDFVARFQREAKTIAALQHPHIVPIYHYDTQDDLTYFVMPLLTGGTVANRLGREQPLPSMGEVSELLNPLASALDYAHSQNVIHRDIKANNVMFDKNGTPYIVDFGIAKFGASALSLTKTGTSMGTPFYMAPEQWRGEQVTPSIDQYALGVLVYLLITGRLPFEGETPESVMYKHLSEKITPPEGLRAEIPASLTPVMRRVLAKTPRERFPNVTSFAQAFERAIAGRRGRTGGFRWRPVRTATKVNDTATARVPLPENTAPSPWKSVFGNPLAWMAGLLMLLLALEGIRFFILPPEEGGDVVNDLTAIAGTNEVVMLHNTSIAYETSTAIIQMTVTLFTPTPTVTPTPLPPTATSTPTATPTATPPSGTPELVGATLIAGPTSVAQVTAPQLVIADALRYVYAAPRSDSASLGTISNQAVNVTGLSVDGAWAQIEFDGQTGWVRYSPRGVTLQGNVSALPAIDTRPPVVLVGSARSVIAEPAMGSAALGIVRQQTLPITGVSVDGAWIRVDYQGQTGWLRLVRLSMSVEGDLRSVPLFATEPLVPLARLTVNGTRSVYAEPHADSERVGTARNRRLAITGISLDQLWLQVFFNGQTAWVRYSPRGVSVEGDLASLPTFNARGEPVPQLLVGGTRSLYAEPRSDSERVGTARNQRLAITGISGDQLWLQVFFNGQTAWVRYSPRVLTIEGDLASVPVLATETPPTETAGAILIVERARYVYAEPRSSSQSLGLARGLRLPIVGVTADRDWVQVEFEGQIGWIRNSRLAVSLEGDLSSVPIIEPDDATGTNTTEPTGAILIVEQARYVYAEPRSSSQSLGLAREVRLPIVGVTADHEWVQVEFEGQIGWIRNSRLAVSLEGDLSSVPIIEPGAPDGETNEAGEATGAILIVERARYVYAEPRSSSQSLGLARAVRLPIVGVTADRDWVQVEFEGQIGWVRFSRLEVSTEGDLSSVPIIEADAPDGETGTNTTEATGAILIVERARYVYAEPRSSSQSLGLARAVRLPIVGVTANRDWVQVEFEGQIGWVRFSRLEVSTEGDLSSVPIIEPGAPDGETNEAGEATGAILIVERARYVYAEPRSSSQSLGLARGVRLSIVGVTANRDWVQVKFEGQIGWVRFSRLAVSLEGDLSSVPVIE